MSLVTLRGVGKRYGAVVALADVDLDIPAEGRTAIVGASGSGKTTMLRLIAGFESPDTGSISMGGQPLAEGSLFVAAHRRGIGYVPQDGALFPHLSVAANIGFAIPRSQPDRKARIAELLDLVQLGGIYLDRRPHELSGGQQQRVALARALAVRPRLVLLDEPFSALDAGLRDSLRKAVADVLAKAGVSTVLVTHDQAEALSFATHLVVLREGRLAQAGPPQELYRAPRDPAIAEFLGEALVLNAELHDGWAHCVLGRVPIRSKGRKGPGKILVRPEQLVLQPAAQLGEAAETIVTDVTFGGAANLVQMRWVDTTAPVGTASFSCRMAGIPPAIGDRLAVAMAGEAHVFP